MKGNINVVISNNRLCYNLTLDRRITIIKGKSGTGKTTLYNMVDSLCKTSRPVGLNCNCRDRLLVMTNMTYKYIVKDNICNKIILVDEYDFSTLDMSEFINNSDNYFIIFTRSCRFSNIRDYSDGSLYELKTSKINNMSVTNLVHLG